MSSFWPVCACPQLQNSEGSRVVELLITEERHLGAHRIRICCGQSAQQVQVGMAFCELLAGACRRWCSLGIFTLQQPVEKIIYQETRDFIGCSKWNSSRAHSSALACCSSQHWNSLTWFCPQVTGTIPEQLPSTAWREQQPVPLGRAGPPSAGRWV